ncbi:MAG: hypothetical protein RL037_2228 [Bacteroidota bacterium]
MKYAIFSTYRTASTLLTCMVSNHFEIQDFGELTGGIPQDKRDDPTVRHQYLADKLSESAYAVKLFSYDFGPANYYFNKDTFDWSIFDKIICTTRGNVTDQMCSVYYMKPWIPSTQEQHPLPINTTPEEIDFSDAGWMAQLERQRRGLILFHSIKDTLLSAYPTKACTVPSEIFMDEPSEYLPILNSLTGIPFVEADLYPNSAFSLEQLGLNYQTKYTNYNDLKSIVDSWNVPRL